MKTNKILSFLSAGLLLMAGACQDKVKYEPADLFTGDEVYFDLNEIGQLDIDTDATSVSFHLYRVNTSKEITVGLESTVMNPQGEDASEIFGVPTEVTFPAGESVIEVPVSVVFSAVESEVPYAMAVKIAGETTTPYGATSGEFTLIYGVKYPDWQEYLAGEDGVFQMAGLWSYVYEAPVYTRVSINRPELTQFKISGPFSDLEYDYLMTVNNEYTVTVEGETEPCYLVTVPLMPLEAEGFDPFGDGSIFCFVDAYLYVENIIKAQLGVANPTTAQVIQIAEKGLRNPLQLSYFKPSTGEIVLNLMVQKKQDFDALGGGYYSSAGGLQHLQLPGFKTYELAIFESGYNVDPSGDQEKKFTFYKSEDTPEMKYGLYKGTLTEEEVAAKATELLNDKDIEAITENEYTVAFSIESGDYTIVLIGIDGEEVKVTKTYNFTYTSPSAFVTVGTCAFTDGLMNSVDTELPTVTVECPVLADPAQPGVYRLKNPYRAWAQATENEDMIMDGNYYLTVNVEDPKMVYVEESNLGIRQSVFNGAFYGYSIAAQKLAQGVRPGVIKLRKECGTLTGNVIEFPVSTLLVAQQSELPNYNVANVKATFKIVLDLNADQSHRIEGRRVRAERISSRVAISGAPVELSIR